jgi:hypothetical protein
LLLNFAILQEKLRRLDERRELVHGQVLKVKFIVSSA